MKLTQDIPKDSQVSYVATEHLKEWVEGSAVSKAIASSNIESISAEDANKRVKPKHPIKDDGWWCRGVNWRTGEYLSERHGQFKPNHPHHDPEKDSDAKYLTASRITPDAVFLKMPGDDRYWQNIHASSGHPIFWTEGVKKAAAGLSLGLATIALTGVWNFGKGKNFAPEVLAWIKRGGIQYLCFDSDYRDKPHCRDAIRRFCNLARECGTELRIVSWDAQWKGIDDFIIANSKDAFLEAVNMAQLIEQWEKQFNKDDDNDKPSKSRPVPRLVAKEIAEDFQQRFKYHNQQQLWRYWNDKYWEKYDDGSFLSAVKTILDSKNINYKGSAFLSDVVKLLECDLRVRHWKTFDTSKYIAFSNSVLEVSTRKLLEHSPGFGFISHLPYDYKPIIIQNNILDTLKTGCPSTYKFLTEAMKGDERGIKKLLAVINGVIKFRFSELQQFVHLSGKPGTGKGTFLRLLQKCVGKGNYQGSSLSSLSSEYELASIIDKQLVIFSDERKQVGCETILKLTGGDDIRFREIRKSPGSAPFLGTTVIASNHTVFMGDTTGLDRRICLIPFNNPVPIQKRTGELENLMDKEIPQLIAVALQLSDQEVTQLIRGYGDADIAAFRLHEWQMKMESNSVAAFLNDALVIDPTAESRVSFLFDCYKKFCDDAGLKPLSQVKFPKYLDELCSDYLGEAVTWDKSRRHAYFVGLRLRTEDDDRFPNYEQYLMKLSEASQLAPVAPVDAPVDTPVDAPVEPLSNGSLHQLHQLDGGVIENNISNQHSEVQPVELPQTEPENLPPPDISNQKSSQTKKDLEFVKKYTNGEELTSKEQEVIKLTADIIRYQLDFYKTKEAFLKEWQKLKPSQVHLANLVLGCCKDGEKFFTKFLPRLGITPTELGVSDPNPKPVEPNGDQISLFD